MSDIVALTLESVMNDNPFGEPINLDPNEVIVESSFDLFDINEAILRCESNLLVCESALQVVTAEGNIADQEDDTEGNTSNAAAGSKAYEVPQKKLNIFQKIGKAIVEFFKWLGGLFVKLANIIKEKIFKRKKQDPKKVEEALKGMAAKDETVKTKIEETAQQIDQLEMYDELLEKANGAIDKIENDVDNIWNAEYWNNQQEIDEGNQIRAALIQFKKEAEAKKTNGVNIGKVVDGVAIPDKAGKKALDLVAIGAKMQKRCERLGMKVKQAIDSGSTKLGELNKALGEGVNKTVNNASDKVEGAVKKTVDDVIHGITGDLKAVGGSLQTVGNRAAALIGNITALSKKTEEWSLDGAQSRQNAAANTEEWSFDGAQARQNAAK